MSESIQTSINEIADALRSQATKQGARELFGDLSAAVARLPKFGVDVAIGDWQAITQAPVPGWPEGEGRGAKGLRM